jgi:hypothetical protein
MNRHEIGWKTERRGVQALSLLRRNTTCGALAVLVAFAVCAASPADAQYSIEWFTIDGGGAPSSGGGSTLGGTIGQPDAGRMTGGLYSLKGGFWLGGTSLVGVGDGEPHADLPLAFRLHAGYPNPVVRSTVVAFDLPAARNVRLRIYDSSGRLARRLVEGSMPAGRHQRLWDGADDGGRRVAAGVYFIRFESETDQATRKIAVLR